MRQRHGLFFQTYKFCRLTNFSDSQTRAYALHCLLTQAVCSLLTRTKNKCLLRSRLFLVCLVSKLIWLDLAYNVHDRAITGFNDTYYSVSKLNLLRLAYDGVCDVTQFFNGLKWQVYALHCLDQILSSWVDGNAIISDNYVNALSRSGYSGNFAADCRDPSLKQWCDNDGTLSSCCCIRMSALGTGDHTVRAYNHVAVKVYVHFQCRKDNKIQLIYYSALVKWVCILTGRNTEML